MLLSSLKGRCVTGLTSQAFRLSSPGPHGLLCDFLPSEHQRGHQLRQPEFLSLWRCTHCSGLGLMDFTVPPLSPGDRPPTLEVSPPPTDVTLHATGVPLPHRRPLPTGVPSPQMSPLPGVPSPTGVPLPHKVSPCPTGVTSPHRVSPPATGVPSPTRCPLPHRCPLTYPSGGPSPHRRPSPTGVPSPHRCHFPSTGVPLPPGVTFLPPSPGRCH